MESKKVIFAQFKDQNVYKYTLKNKNGMKISCLSYGAILYEFTDETGNNLILNYSEFSEYVNNPLSLGLTIGRTAGRIKNAEFKIRNVTHKVDVNEGDYSLHGGPNGFGKLIWNGKIEENSIIFERTIMNVEDNFPGDIEVIVKYTLTDDNQLIINYSAKSNQDTVFNPTCHTYFNLNSGDSDVLNHKLKIDSKERLALKNSIPTDKTIKVENTEYDFRKSTPLSESIKSSNDRQIDDIFLTSELADEPIAQLKNDDNQVEIYSDRNALVMYLTGDFSEKLTFFNDKTSRPYLGIALEAQEAPNAISNKKFGDISLKKNEVKEYQIVYKYKKIS